MTNTCKTTLAFSLLFSVCTPATAMNAGFGDTSFGEMPSNGESSEKKQPDLQAQMADHVAKFKASRENQLPVVHPVTQSLQGVAAASQALSPTFSDAQDQKEQSRVDSPDTQELLEVNRGVQEEFDNFVRTGEDAIQEELVAVNAQTNAVNNEIANQLGDNVAVDVAGQDRVDVVNGEEVPDQAQLNEVVNLEQVRHVDGEAHVRSNAIESNASEQEGDAAQPDLIQFPEEDPVPNEESPAVGTTANNADAVPAPSEKFYAPALKAVQAVPGYIMLDYLKKNDVRDFSLENLGEHKAKLLATCALCAVVVGAVGGMIYRVAQFFKQEESVEDAFVDDVANTEIEDVLVKSAHFKRDLKRRGRMIHGRA